MLLEITKMTETMKTELRNFMVTWREKVGRVGGTFVGRFICVRYGRERNGTNKVPFCLIGDQPLRGLKRRDSRQFDLFLAFLARVSETVCLVAQQPGMMSKGFSVSSWLTLFDLGFGNRMSF